MRGKFVLTSLLVGVLLGVGVVFAAGNVAAQAPAGEQAAAVSAAANWLVSAHQNVDGGYTSFSSGAGAADSDVGGTVDAVLALAAAGYNVAAPIPDQVATPMTYLEENSEAMAVYAAQGGGPAGKVILALVAANQDPRDFAGNDYVVSLTEQLSPTGQFNATNAFNQSLAILALSAVSETVPAEAMAWLADQQATEGDVAGSWSDGFGTVGNTDGTAMAVMALAAAGAPPDNPVLVAARDFLANAQLESGGWPYGPETGESANSTALAVQALSALGEDFYSAEGEWAQNGVSPLAALLAWQGESGAFQADFGDGPFADFFTTVQALPAVTGKPYPFPGRAEAARHALACLATAQDPETGGWESFPGSGPDAGGTSRAIQAILAAGGDPTAERWTVNGTNALEALEALAPAYLAGGRGGRIGIVMQAVAPAGGDVTDFAGANLVISMTNVLSPTGEYASTAFGPFSHAEAMLGLIAAGEPVDAAAVQWLLDAQENGDWGGPDATGISLHVLSKLGEEVPDAITTLRETQLADGGWALELPSSVNSTSEAVQGLVAADVNPFAPTWSVVVSGTLQSPADVVLAQQAESGCWPNLFGPGDDPFSTTDGIIMLAQQPPWGAADDAAMAPEATEEPTATPEAEAATATPEPEPTEEMAEPTAEPTEEPTATAEPTATSEPEPTAEPTVAPTLEPPTPAEDAGPNGVVVIIAIVAVLALFGGMVFWLIRETDSGQ